jgi:hypothetical protein
VALADQLKLTLVLGVKISKHFSESDEYLGDLRNIPFFVDIFPWY